MIYTAARPLQKMSFCDVIFIIFDSDHLNANIVTVFVGQEAAQNFLESPPICQFLLMQWEKNIQICIGDTYCWNESKGRVYY